MDPNIRAIAGCQMPDKQKLTGSENWNTWKSTLQLYFKLLGIDKFFEGKPEEYAKITEIQKAQALLLIRQNLTVEPLNLIFDEMDPDKALSYLQASYQGTGPVLWQQLYLEFHGIKVENFHSLNEFISNFKGYLSKLASVGAKIDDIDQKTIFVAALQESYPVWADRQRSALRSSTNQPTLDALVTDILDESRKNPDTVMGNSYYNGNGKGNGKSGKNNSRNNSRSDNNRGKSNGNGNGKGKGNNSNNSNKSKPWNKRSNGNGNGSNKSKDSSSNDFKERKKLPRTNEKSFFNFSQFPKKLTTVPQDWWLYDTGSSRHISNKKSNFHDLIEKPDLPPIITGGGKVFPKGIGKITLPFAIHGDIRYITLNNVLWIPEFPLNIMSGQLHYRKGGIISGNKLLDSKKRPFAVLNQEKRGFFLHLHRTKEPDMAMLAINPLKIVEKSRVLGEEALPAYPEPESSDIEEIRISNSSNFHTVTEEWHKKLGHPSYNILAKTAKITSGIPEEKLKKQDLNCESCLSGKFTRNQSRINKDRATTPLYRICVDTVYITPTSFSGYKYITGFTDDNTSFREIEFSKEKSDIFDIVKNKIEYYRTQFGKYPNVIRMDNGREFSPVKLQEYLTEKGIILETSAPYTPEQNGVAERTNRIFIEKTRTVFTDIGLPKTLWEFISKAVVLLINYTAKSTGSLTPYQEFFDFFFPDRDNKPDLSKIPALGTPVLVYKPKENRITSDKFGNITENGIIVGYNGSKIYYVYLPDRPYKSRIIRTPHIRILNNSNQGEKSQDTEEFGIIETPEDLPLTANQGENTLSSTNSQSSTTDPANLPGPKPVNLPGSNPVDLPGPNLGNNDNSNIQNSKIEIQLPEMPASEREKYQKYDDTFADISYYSTLENSGYTEPKTIKQALKSPEKKEWLAAIHAEIRQLIRKKTFQAIDRNNLQKSGKIPLSVKWVFKRKTDKNGNIDKYKARLVVRGFEQRYGIDYFQTFATGTKSTTWRLLFALAAYHDWEIEQIDIIGAFLNGNLDEEVYITPIPGLSEFLDEFPEENNFGWRNNDGSQVI